jgi:hypothetical protein
MTLSTYAHLFEELENAERRSAADEIRRARGLTRSSRTRFVPERSTTRLSRATKGLLIGKSRRPDSNRGPPSLRVKGSLACNRWSYAAFIASGARVSSLRV